MLLECWNNRILRNVVIAWAIACLLKGFINMFQKKKLDLWRFFGHGGMPSTHSAAVTSLAASVGLSEGWGTAATAVAVVFALIVMVDAAGVRQATGKHAKALNQIILGLSKGEPGMERFQEFIGHTPLQVLFGAIIGMAVGFLSA